MQCAVSEDLFEHSDTEEKLTAKTTRNHPDDSDRNDYSEALRVDLCFYPVSGAAKTEYSIPKPKDPHNAHTRWAWISLLAESKAKAPASGHPEGSTVTGEAGETQEKSQPKPFVRSGVGAEGSLGQMAEYVAKIFRRQHRTHLFTLFVFQGQARVIRWDRAGAIVSTVIDFEQQPTLLHEIIWRYAHMSQAQRGFDTTAVLASKEEVDAMRTCAAPDEWIAQRLNSALDQRGWPVYKLTMLPSDLVDQSDLKPITIVHTPMPLVSGKTKLAASSGACFIVGRRYFTTNSPTGRGTKCYIAYDISSDRLVFLKDFWRPDVTSAQPEGSVLRELRSSGVRNVPTPLAAGDVRNSDMDEAQKTSTQAHLARDEKTKRRPATLIHYRLVVQEICRPLEDHDSPLTLTKAMLDALIAHRQAYELKKYLHRDLSNNNILLWYYLDVNGELRVIGILNDWDLCKAAQYLDQVSRPGRSGTWQFMSARLLRNPGKKHELADDLEALVHVLRWMSLRFYKHILTGLHTQLSQHIVSVFESSDFVHGEREDVGGGIKYLSMLKGQDVVSLTAAETPLARLLEELTEICRDHYQATEPKATITGRSHFERFDDAALRNEWKALVDIEHLTQRSVTPQSAVSATSKQTKLSDHQAFLEAFIRAMMAPHDEWSTLAKTADQFEHPEYKSAMMQRPLERSDISRHVSAGSKRSLEEGEGKPGRSKRSRGATQSAVSGLGAVDEE
ncbi:hypothetical protein C8Q72DRAFT_781077 [Fomitopsis betulina]|nr:hypothetical protein C8Q72DRAFT_781077 [Fomitopsis betulina]